MDQYNQQNPNRQGNYQQPYQPPYQPAPPAYDPTTQVMSIGQYVGMFILSALPVVNLICWIVWLCSPNTNKNKKELYLGQHYCVGHLRSGNVAVLCLRRHRRSRRPVLSVTRIKIVLS